MTEAAVGSISHILQTAFKDAYDEKKKMEETERRRLRKAELLAEQEERRARREERRRQIEEGEIEPDEDEEEDPEEEEDGVQEGDDEEEKEEDYHNPVDDIPLCDDYRNTLNNRVESVHQDIKRKTKDAKELLSYLGTQRKVAKELEAEEEEMLKKQGVMVGQHIPSLVSKLDVDPGVVNSFGEMSTNMIISRELIDKNKERKLRRTGNLPISKEAEDRKTMRMKNKKEEVEDTAHYLQSTKSIRERSNIINAKFSQSLESHRTQRQEKTFQNSTMAKSSTKIPKRDYGLSAIDKERDQAVLKNINHRLNYLRAPRNDPAAVKKTLVNTRALGKGPGSIAQSSADATSLPSQQISTSVTSTNAGSSLSTVTPGALFLPEPEVIIFDAYEIGKCYSQTVTFRNISSSCRTIRVIPPASPHFSMSRLKYPSVSKGGIVAPGMCVKCELSFYPQSLADYYDCIQVETEGGSYDVEIVARREPPVLSLPSVIEVSDCLVGDAIRSSLTCLNSGGRGSFKIVRESNYPNVPEDLDFGGCLRIPPFTLYPLEFSLDKGESVDITLEFMPTAIASYEEVIYVVGDNEQAKSVTLKSAGRQVDVFISEINSLEVPARDDRIQKNLFFNPTFVGADSEQEIVIRNDTGIQLEYEWVWVEQNCDNIFRRGLEEIIMNEQNNKSIKLDCPGGNPSPKSPQAVTYDSKPLTASDVGISIEGGDKNTSSKGNFLLSSGFPIEGGGLSNHLYYDDFGISPCRGVLAIDGTAPFVVSYKASKLGTTSGKAVLMLRDVTQQSVPGENQELYLNEMLEHGHGSAFRLRSWIEEIGVYTGLGISESAEEAALEVGIRLQNIPTNRISVDTLCSLVRSHCKKADENALKRFRYIAGRMLSKADRYSHRTSVQLEDDDSVLLAMEAPPLLENDEVAENCVRVEFFEWNGSEDQGPLRYPLLELEVPDDIPDLESIEKGYIDIDDAGCANLRKILWLDATSCLNILGDALCQILESLINHDAIDFVQRISRISLPALAMDVTGVGASPAMSFYPPKLNIGGGLAIGKPWKGTVTFTNPSSIICELNIDPTRVKLGNIVAPDNVYVTVSSEHVVVLPHETETVVVTVLIDIIGKFNLSLPVFSKCSAMHVDDITISVSTVGPKVRFESPELDLGLVGTGFETKKVVTFSNDTEIPLKFSLNCVVGSVLTEYHNKSRLRTVGSDTDSMSSMPSTARSNMTEMSMDSFNIDHSKATYNFDPPSGELGPHQSVQATVICSGGKFPERIRGVLECRVSDVKCLCDIPTQYISVRGEVQSPLTILYPATIDMGHIYVNTPVTFTVFLRNVSSLEAKYKFERPGGDAAAYRIAFEEKVKSGTLVGRELRECRIEFTALNSGIIDDIYGCKIFGSSTPLGFQIKATAKSINVDFKPLLEGEEPPAPIAKPTDAQFPGGSDLIPEPYPLTPIEFGNSVDLYERVSRRFVIRNLSAMKAHFNIRPRKYDVGDNFDFSLIQPPVKLAKGTLVANEDGENRYHSEAGKKYIGALLKRREDKKFLQLRLGSSYVVEPMSGVVDPWGVCVINVLARNDMPGCFDDDLLVDIKDHRRLPIPMKMNVLGCPLVIERDSFGMSRLRNGEQEADVVDSLAPLMLEMGNASVNADPLIREFRVRNNGSFPATLKWKLRSVHGKVNGPLKVEVNLSALGSKSKDKVKTSLLFWDDVAKDSPFNVDPKVTVIPPYGRKNFKVKLLRTSNEGEELALLTGSISFKEEIADDDVLNENTTLSVNAMGSKSSPPSPDGRRPSNTGLESVTSNTNTNANATTVSNTKTNYKISLHLRAKLVMPMIKVGQRMVATAPDTMVKVHPDQGINMFTQAPLLFARGSRPSEVCTQVVTLTNPLPTALLFSISMDGPFSIKSITDEEASGKKKKDLDGSSSIAAGSVVTTHTNRSSKSAAGSLAGATIQLLAQKSARYLVAFTPRRDLRNKMLHSSAKGAVGSPDVKESGSITITFSTGHSVLVPVTAALSTPFISASSPRLYFGVCHTSKEAEGTLLLNSPTDVLARWSVQHIPGAGSSRKVSAIRVQGFAPAPSQDDDPTVFDITPNSGVLQGPTVSPTAAMYCPPNDVNRNSTVSVIEQRPVKTSWANKQLNLNDSLELRHHHSKVNEIDPIYPLPIVVKFKPKKNTRYSSRFRFVCEYGNTFDVLLEGQGTFEEHEHNPSNPHP